MDRQLTDAVDVVKHPQDGTLERRWASDELLVPPVVELNSRETKNGGMAAGIRWSFCGAMDRMGRDRELRARLRQQTSVEAIRGLWNPVRTPPGHGLLASFLQLGEPCHRACKVPQLWALKSPHPTPMEVRDGGGRCS